MRGSDGNEMARGKIWKDYMKSIMNEEIDWDHKVGGDAEEDPVDCVCSEDVMQALNEI